LSTPILCFPCITTQGLVVLATPSKDTLLYRAPPLLSISLTTVTPVVLCTLLPPFPLFLHTCCTCTVDSFQIKTLNSKKKKKECKSVWDKYIAICKMCGTKVVGKCVSCTKSQAQKDIEHHVAKAEEMGQQDNMIPMGKATVLGAEMPSDAVDR
jgi:hypothetical protein